MVNTLERVLGIDADDGGFTRNLWRCQCGRRIWGDECDYDCDCGSQCAVIRVRCQECGTEYRFASDLRAHESLMGHRGTSHNSSDLKIYPFLELLK